MHLEHERGAEIRRHRQHRTARTERERMRCARPTNPTRSLSRLDSPIIDNDTSDRFVRLVTRRAFAIAHRLLHRARLHARVCLIFGDSSIPTIGFVNDAKKY